VQEAFGQAMAEGRKMGDTSNAPSRTVSCILRDAETASKEFRRRAGRLPLENDDGQISKDTIETRPTPASLGAIQHATGKRRRYQVSFTMILLHSAVQTKCTCSQYQSPTRSRLHS